MRRTATTAGGGGGGMTTNRRVTFLFDDDGVDPPPSPSPMPQSPPKSSVVAANSNDNTNNGGGGGGRRTSIANNTTTSLSSMSLPWLISEVDGIAARGAARMMTASAMLLRCAPSPATAAAVVVASADNADDDGGGAATAIPARGDDGGGGEGRGGEAGLRAPPKTPSSSSSSSATGKDEEDRVANGTATTSSLSPSPGWRVRASSSSAASDDPSSSSSSRWREDITVGGGGTVEGRRAPPPPTEEAIHDERGRGGAVDADAAGDAGDCGPTRPAGGSPSPPPTTTTTTGGGATAKEEMSPSSSSSPKKKEERRPAEDAIGRAVAHPKGIYAEEVVPGEASSSTAVGEGGRGRVRRASSKEEEVAKEERADGGGGEAPPPSTTDEKEEDVRANVDRTPSSSPPSLIDAEEDGAEEGGGKATPSAKGEDDGGGGGCADNGCGEEAVGGGEAPPPTKDDGREDVEREKTVPPSTTGEKEDSLADAFGCLRDDGYYANYGCRKEADVGGRALPTTKDDGHEDLEREKAVPPSSENASDAPSPAKEYAPSMSPSPPITEVDAATATSTAGGALAAARLKSPSSRLKTSLIATVDSKNKRPFPRGSSFEAFEVMYRPKEKDHPAAMRRKLLEATQTLKSHAVKTKKFSSFDGFATKMRPSSPRFGGFEETTRPMTKQQRPWSPTKDEYIGASKSPLFHREDVNRAKGASSPTTTAGTPAATDEADHWDHRVSVVASKATKGIELQLMEKGVASNDPAFHCGPSIYDDSAADLVSNLQHLQDELFSSPKQDRCRGNKDGCSTDSPIGVDSFPSFAGMAAATHFEDDRSLDRMQPHDSCAGRKKKLLSLLDVISVPSSMNSSAPSVDSMSAIYSQDEHKMLQRTMCREKNIILMEYRSPSACSAKSEMTRDSTGSVHHLLGWDFTIPSPLEKDQQQQKARDCNYGNALESAYEDFGIERQLVKEIDTNVTQSKSSKVGRKMRLLGGNFYKDKSGQEVRQNLVDVDEVTLSVASQISNGNIESLMGIHNLCNCFYGDYGDVVDDGDDDTSKGVQISGLDKLLDAINDSKLLGEYDDELHSEWVTAVDDESLTYDCGESITVEEGENFNVRTKSSPRRPKEAIANTDAVKMKSVVFLAMNVDNPRKTIRFLTKE